MWGELSMEGGAGKYNHICEHALRVTDADAVALVVIGGTHGSGWVVKLLAPSGGSAADFYRTAASTLRRVAADLEAVAATPASAR